MEHERRYHVGVNSLSLSWLYIGPLGRRQPDPHVPHVGVIVGLQVPQRRG